MKPLNVITDYFKGVQVEVRKVTWPTAPILGQHLLSVILGIGLFVAFIALADYVFIHLLTFIIK